MPEKIEIPAIHDDDLKILLEKHGIMEKLEKGEVKCFLCDSVITWDNIYGLVLEDCEPKLICDSFECVEKIDK